MLRQKSVQINKKFLIALETNKLSKQLRVFPKFLGLVFNKKFVSVKFLGFKLGGFFLRRRKVWHKK
jgi:hypothetical protein